MKKLILMLAIVAAVSLSASAKDKYTRDTSLLPKAAMTTIDNNFKAKVSVIKVDKELGRIADYEVILTDGTEIEFDRNGNWKNIETQESKSVPEKFVPSAVSQYVKANHKGARIVGIEKERRGYDVELSTGIDLKFDKAGRFLRYD